MKSLEQRMNHLEKQVLTSRIVIFLLVGIISTFLITGFREKQTPPDVIQAKKFEVVNGAGDVLMRLNAEDGNGNLALFTPKGTELVELFSSTGGGGAINTFDTDGKVNFKVTRTTEGGGYMALFNSNRKEIFETGCTDKNTGYLQLNDSDGGKLAWFTYTQGGGGYFSLMNRYNKSALTFSTADAGGRVGVYNSDNTRVCYMGAQDNKDGNITVYKSDGSRTGGIPTNY